MNIRAILVPVAGAALIAGLVVTINQAEAGRTHTPLASVYRSTDVGGLVPCNVTNCMGTILDGPLGAGTDFTTSGPATVTVTGFNEDDDGATTGVRLQASSWSGTGSSDQLGEVVWEFDPDRIADGSNITAHSAGEDFPATGDLYFYITGTLSAFPEARYRSVEPIHLHADNLNSYNPFVNEQFTLAEPVEFEDINNPDAETFTLESIDLTFEGDSPQPLR